MRVSPFVAAFVGKPVPSTPGHKSGATLYAGGALKKQAPIPEKFARSRNGTAVSGRASSVGSGGGAFCAKLRGQRPACEGSSYERIDESRAARDRGVRC